VLSQSPGATSCPVTCAGNPSSAAFRAPNTSAKSAKDSAVSIQQPSLDGILPLKPACQRFGHARGTRRLRRAPFGILQKFDVALYSARERITACRLRNPPSLDQLPDPLAGDHQQLAKRL
jgi:hypothetical protein